MDVSVFIPVRKFSQNLMRTQEVLAHSLRSLSFHFEIFIFDETGLKETQTALEDVPPGSAHLQVITHARPQGLGACFREFLGLSQGRRLIYLNSQQTFDFELLPVFLDKLNQSDIILISRYEALSGKAPKLRWQQRGYRFFCRSLLKIPSLELVPDLMAMRRESLQEMSLRSNNEDIFFELFEKAWEKGFAIAEFPNCFCPISARQQVSFQKALGLWRRKPKKGTHVNAQ